MSDKELGGYLKRKGLDEATLKQRRSSMVCALGKPQRTPKGSRALQEAENRICTLESNLKRKVAVRA